MAAFVDKFGLINEVNFETFYQFISDVCSAKSDIEENFQVEKSKKDLKHFEKIIGLFIEKYNKVLELENQLIE